MSRLKNNQITETNRLAACFQTLSISARSALIPFITAGDPDPDFTTDIMHALVAAGADVIELGVPFSDPMADGPVIQLSSERAIERGVSLHTVLENVSEFRLANQHTPVVLMGYLNPVIRMGFKNFARAAAIAGVDAVLIVDSPPEESAKFELELADNKLAMIRLVAPTTTAARMKFICKNAQGFIYYVALKGITGAGSSSVADTLEVQAKIDNLRKLSGLPVAAGFGIKGAQSAAQWAGIADAVVIGSALVESLAKCNTLKSVQAQVANFLAPVRAAMDNRQKS